MNQPVVHPLDGTTNGKDPRWPKVTVPRGKKKKLLTAREHEPVASPVSGLWTSWCRGVPQCSLVAMPGPPNRLTRNTLPFTPAHGAFIGPKHHNLTIVLEMDVTAAPTTGSLQPRVASAQLMLPLPLVPVAFADKAVLCPLLASRQRRVDPIFACSPSDKMLRQQVTYAGPAHNLVQFEPRWTRLTGTADQSFLQVSLALIWALTYQSLPFRSLRSKCPFRCWIELSRVQAAQAFRSACGFLPPLWGGRGTKKKKKHPGG